MYKRQLKKKTVRHMKNNSQGHSQIKTKKLFFGRYWSPIWNTFWSIKLRKTNILKRKPNKLKWKLKTWKNVQYIQKKDFVLHFALTEILFDKKLMYKALDITLLCTYRNKNRNTWRYYVILLKKIYFTVFFYWTICLSMSLYNQNLSFSPHHPPISNSSRPKHKSIITTETSPHQQCFTAPPI